MSKTRKQKKLQKTRLPSTVESDKKIYSDQVQEAISVYSMLLANEAGLKGRFNSASKAFITTGNYKSTTHYLLSALVIIPAARTFVQEEINDQMRRTVLISVPPYDGFDKHLGFAYTFNHLYGMRKQSEQKRLDGLLLPGERYVELEQMCGITAKPGELKISAVPGQLFNYMSGKPALRLGSGVNIALMLDNMDERFTHAVAHFEFYQGKTQPEYRNLRMTAHADKYMKILQEALRPDGVLDVFVLNKLNAEESVLLMELHQQGRFVNPMRFNHPVVMKEEPLVTESPEEEVPEDPEAELVENSETETAIVAEEVVSTPEELVSTSEESAAIPEEATAISKESVSASEEPKPEMVKLETTELDVTEQETGEAKAIKLEATESKVESIPTTEEINKMAEELAPEVAEEVIEKVSEVASEPSLEEKVEASSEATSEVDAELTSVTIPEAISESAAEPTSEATSEPASEPTPEPTPERITEPTPEPTPEDVPPRKKRGRRPGRPGLTRKITLEGQSDYQIRPGWVEIEGQNFLAWDYVGADQKGPGLTLLHPQERMLKELDQGKFVSVEERFRIAPAEVFCLDYMTDEVAYAPGYIGMEADSTPEDMRFTFTIAPHFATHKINVVLVRLETKVNLEELQKQRTFKVLDGLTPQEAAAKGVPWVVRADLMHRCDIMYDQWYPGEAEEPTVVYLVLNLAQSLNYGLISAVGAEFFKPKL